MRISIVQFEKVFSYSLIACAIAISVLSLVMFEPLFNRSLFLGLTRQSICWLASLYLLVIAYAYRRHWPTVKQTGLVYAHMVLTLVLVVFFVSWVNVCGSTLFSSSQVTLNDQIANNLDATKRYPVVIVLAVCSQIPLGISFLKGGQMYDMVSTERHTTRLWRKPGREGLALVKSNAHI